MGLLREIVLLPLAPVRFVAWSLDHVVATTEEQQRQQVRRELSELERALLAGEITEAEFDRREDEVLDQLDPQSQIHTGKGTTT